MKMLFNLKQIGAFAILILAVTACKKDVSTLNDNANVQMSPAFKSNTNNVEGITFYALGGNRLDKYQTSNPEMIISSATITGLQAGETILGIDFRPATGELYALGSNSRLYTINPSSGMSTYIADLSTIPMGSTTAVPLTLSGSSFGFDFNPVVDRIRIVSNTGQNLRANPTTGVTIVDGSINPQPASVNGVAYGNNQAGVTTTKLYAFDVATGNLFSIIPPNNGTLAEANDTKLKLTGDGGFDIAPRSLNVTSDIGLGLYEVDKKSTLFRIDLTTGQTKILAKYDKEVMYSAIAISAGN